MSELATRETHLATQQPTPTELIQAILASGQQLNEASVNAIGQLLGYANAQEDRTAEREFSKAFVAMQRELTGVSATSVVPNSGGQGIRYKFAPYEEIMRTVKPVLDRNGFAVTYDTILSPDGSRVSVTCTLIHEGTHKRSNTYTGRIGKGPPGSSESQTDGAGYTYAKRFALCAALNITVEQDTDGAQDARSVGGPISAERAAEFERRSRALFKKPEKISQLLSWAKASTFEEIPTSMDAEMDRFLTEKEAGK